MDYNLNLNSTNSNSNSTEDYDLSELLKLLNQTRDYTSELKSNFKWDLKSDYNNYDDLGMEDSISLMPGAFGILEVFADILQDLANAFIFGDLMKIFAVVFLHTVTPWYFYIYRKTLDGYRTTVAELPILTNAKNVILLFYAPFSIFGTLTVLPIFSYSGTICFPLTILFYLMCGICGIVVNYFIQAYKIFLAIELLSPYHQQVQPEIQFDKKLDYQIPREHSKRGSRIFKIYLFLVLRDILVPVLAVIDFIRFLRSGFQFIIPYSAVFFVVVYIIFELFTFLVAIFNICSVRPEATNIQRQLRAQALIFAYGKVFMGVLSASLLYTGIIGPFMTFALNTTDLITIPIIIQLVAIWFHRPIVRKLNQESFGTVLRNLYAPDSLPEESGGNGEQYEVKEKI